MQTTITNSLPLLFSVSAMLVFNRLPAQTWNPTGAPSGAWHAVASSADGRTLAGAITMGPIYISTNSGATWTPTSSPSADWRRIGASDDGMKLVAVVAYGGIYTSTDGGVSWSSSFPSGPQDWVNVACSGDGTKLIACDWGHVGLYTSSDSGTTWALADAPRTNWSAAACSRNGNFILAAVNSGLIYASADGGITWAPTTAPARSWGALACSADGLKWVAAAYQPGGVVYTSLDFGATWRLNNLPSLNWACAASSSDGRRILVGASPGAIYTSSNGGVDWEQSDAPATHMWFDAACSADGERFFAASRRGLIWSSQSIPRLAIASSPAGAVLSWPFSATDYVLESSPQLDSASPWTPLSEGVTVWGETCLVTNSPPSQPMFYRLHKQ